MSRLPLGREPLLVYIQFVLLLLMLAFAALAISRTLIGTMRRDIEDRRRKEDLLRGKGRANEQPGGSCPSGGTVPSIARRRVPGASPGIDAISLFQMPHGPGKIAHAARINDSTGDLLFPQEIKRQPLKAAAVMLPPWGSTRLSHERPQASTWWAM